MTLKVQIVAPNAVRAAANELRKVDKKLPGRMRLLLRRVAQPIMREQRKNIRSMPTRSGGRSSRNLRGNIAKGVRLRLRTGKSPIMRIRTHVPFPAERNKGGMLPRGLDTFFGGFETPWGHQSGTGPSWFMGPPAQYQDDAEREVKKILKMSAAEVRRATANAKRGRPRKTK